MAGLFLSCIRPFPVYRRYLFVIYFRENSPVYWKLKYLHWTTRRNTHRRPGHRDLAGYTLPIRISRISAPAGGTTGVCGEKEGAEKVTLIFISSVGPHFVQRRVKWPLQTKHWRRRHMSSLKKDNPLFFVATTKDILAGIGTGIGPGGKWVYVGLLCELSLYNILNWVNDKLRWEMLICRR